MWYAEYMKRRYRGRKKKEMNYQETSVKEEMRLLTRLNRIYEDRELAKLFPILTLKCWASSSGKVAIDCPCPQCKELMAEVRTTKELPTWLGVIS